MSTCTLLSDSDKHMFKELKCKLQSDRYSKAELFGMIKEYIHERPEDEAQRAIACGICWLKTGLAVNQKRLCKLLKTTNSSLSLSLKKIGYVPSNQPLTELLEKIPMLKTEPMMVREWTMKTYSPITPVPSLEALPHSKSMPACSSPSVEDESAVVELLPEKSNSIFTNKLETSSSIDMMSFFDDPFCCLPIFLVDNMQSN